MEMGYPGADDCRRNAPSCERAVGMDYPGLDKCECRQDAPLCERGVLMDYPGADDCRQDALSCERGAGPGVAWVDGA